MLPPTTPGTTTSSTTTHTIMHSTSATTTPSQVNPSHPPLSVNTTCNNNSFPASSTPSSSSSAPTTVQILVEPSPLLLTSSSSNNNSASHHLDRSTIPRNRHRHYNHNNSNNPTAYPLSDAVTPPSLRPYRVYSTRAIGRMDKHQHHEYLLANKRRGSVSSNSASSSTSSSSNAIYNKKRARLETFLPPNHTISTATTTRQGQSEAYIDKYAIPSPSYPVNLNDDDDAVIGTATTAATGSSSTATPTLALALSSLSSAASAAAAAAAVAAVPATAATATSISLEDYDIDLDSNIADTLHQLPSMVHAYGTLPPDLQSYMLFQLLKRSSTNTLQFVNSIIVPALKRDFLASLPLELALHVISYLDVVSLCRAACVSHKWRSIIDSDMGTWKWLLDKESAEYNDPWQDDNEEDQDTLGDENEEEEEDEETVSATLSTASMLEHSDMDTAEDGEGEEEEDDDDDIDKELVADCVPHLHQGGVQWRQAWYGAGINQYSTNAINGSDNNNNSNSSNYDMHRQHHGTGHSNNSGSRSSSSRSTSSSTSRMDIDGGINETFNRKGKLKAPNHPYKDIYRRRFTIRQNWKHGRAERISFEGHPGHVVTCLEIVDGDKIISGADDCLINIYDIATGQRYHSLQGHEGGVWALQYYRNTLVSGSTDRSVRVWDIRQGVCTHVFLGHTSTVRCLQIIIPTLVNGRMEPSVPLIVTGSRDSTLRVWRLPNLDRDEPFNGVGVNPWFMHTLAGHHHSVRALAAHGNRLVSGSYDCSVCVWNVEEGVLLHRMAGHGQKVYTVVIDPERQRCMSGSMDSTVRIWDMEHGHCLKVLEGHSILVGLLGLTPSYLVSAAADSSLRVWSPDNGGCQHVLSGHRGAITCFHHDETKVISGSEGGLKMWDIKTGRHVRDLITGVNGVWRVAFDRRRCVAAVHR
ncbi:WD40-repeat-containing domain protein [Zychaea mexicana]|uniref:WD40-repeat-containing domain protein n=1 Tax=Zychaea mexicana TaxID=64656 RepID=UPI0022FDE059|nr:WD40-repeat-containing domain protein [Zychaea mexicana]KAI9495486.1 WD40-repeat-containing domain protein [Zychaea mexicana]